MYFNIVYLGESCPVCDISEKLKTLPSNKICIKLFLGMATGTGRDGRRDDKIKLYVRGKT